MISASHNDGVMSPALAPPATPSCAEPAWLDRGAIPALDGMRAVAVLIVMAAHSGLQNVVPGGLGVTTFFFLSGFLITTLLLREWRAEGRVKAGAFYARRVLRLYPPLLVYLSAVVLWRLARAESVDALGLAGALFYGGNYLAALAPDRIQAFGTHLWSLAVEEHFYLAYPLVFAALARSPRPMAILVACCLAALALRVGYALAGVPDGYVIFATESRFDSIIYGALLAFWAATPNARPQLAAIAQPVGFAAALALLLLSLLIRDPMFRDTARFSMQGVALLAIFAALLFGPETSRLRRLLDSRAARWVGALSYSLYLWHSAMFALVEGWVGHGAPLVRVAAGWGAAFLVAFAVYTLIEKPLFGLRRRLGSHVKAPG